MKFTSPLLLAALASSASAKFFGAPAGQPPSRTERGSGHTEGAPLPLGTGALEGQQKGGARPTGQHGVGSLHSGLPLNPVSDFAVPTPAVRNRAREVESDSPRATGGSDGSETDSPRATGGSDGCKADGTGRGRPRATGGSEDYKIQGTGRGGRPRATGGSEDYKIQGTGRGGRARATGGSDDYKIQGTGRGGRARATGGSDDYKIDGTGRGRPRPTGSVNDYARPSRKGGFARPSGHRAPPSQTGSDFAIPTDGSETEFPKPIAARGYEGGDESDRHNRGPKPTETGAFARPTGFDGLSRPSGAAFASGRRHRGGATQSADFPTTLVPGTRPTAIP